MPRQLTLALGLSVLALFAGSNAIAAPINVFNTGTDSSGTVLAGGLIDQNYTIVGAGGSDAKVIGVGLPGAWLPNSSNSKWIWEQSNGLPLNVDRTFRTTFDMTGLDLSSAILGGRWAVDNIGLDILVNGTSTGQNILFGFGSFGSWTAFNINYSLLQSGINTVDFVVRDVGGIAGFRAEFTAATANAASASVPEASSTFLLLGLTVTGLAAWKSRKS